MYAIFYSALTAFLSFALPKIAIFLGVYAISDTVTKPMFLWIQNQVLEKISAAPQFAQAFEIMGVNDFVSIIFSAYALAIGLKAAKSAAAAK